MFIEPHLGGRDPREQAGWIEVIRLSENDQKVLLGEKDQYEARSRAAFFEGIKDRKQ
jgi:thymidine kinase